MVIYRTGDLLYSNCDVICHQVNKQGVMGGGLALQIARRYPKCEREYIKFVERARKHGVDLLGAVCLVKQGGQTIANCFSQDEYFNTDYAAGEQCFLKVKEMCAPPSDRILSVGIPHGYGCGIANGEWREVERVIQNVFGAAEHIVCEIWEMKKTIKNKRGVRK